MLVSLTVGKVDAGVAVLLTEDRRLIEFPSILLPPDISSGSIVDVNVSRNFAAEDHSNRAFSSLQSKLLADFGGNSPVAPSLRCRNATQTSVVLEWDPIVLASAKLRSLSLYRNGNKAGTIPRPHDMTSTKISGLAVDTEYTFNLILKTSAGTFNSDRLTVKTHKMTNLAGITVTPGILDASARADLASTVSRIGAKLIEQVRIDTTHFVCSEPRGSAWERARDMNIPIVLPDWVAACEREGRIAGVRGYYLDADPKLRQSQPSSQSQSQPQPSSQSQSTLNAANAAIPDRGRQDSMAISPMTTPHPHTHHLPPGLQTGAPGAARSMAIPATQITPPTPETTNGEFRSSGRGQHQHAAEAVDTPETVVEQPEAEAVEARGQNDGNGDTEVDDEPAEQAAETVGTGPSMPGGASLTAQHTAAETPLDSTTEGGSTAESATQSGEVDGARDEAGADGQEGKDFDEVTL